ncbi:type II secretion system protein [Roseateles sp. DAIF2]|uniref:type II secretion system protein n=1 Tax=Roseateles sp. DAIF2 TaxID=2714952 RepID=UPI0018A28695|nr:type II secretion system protein [Roseateles sp. DAIF2]QPF76035.1 type II secretion system protein [Roseateles sp. DAIF2]
MLFFVALTAAALAALGQRWSIATQREQERELEFRGQQIALAIASYLKASERLGMDRKGAGALPRSLDDLLLDTRGPKPQHHLRRAYVDPFTGKADWVLVPAPQDPERFHGVHSRSERELLRKVFPDDAPIERAEDWVFLAQAQEQQRIDAGAQAGGGSGEAVPVQPTPTPPPGTPKTE